MSLATPECKLTGFLAFLSVFGQISQQQRIHAKQNEANTVRGNTEVTLTQDQGLSYSAQNSPPHQTAFTKMRAPQ